MKKQTILTISFAVIALLAGGLAVYTGTQNTALKAQLESTEQTQIKMGDRLKTTQAKYLGAHLQSARQFAMLDELRQKAPDAFNTAAANAQKRTNKDLINQLDNADNVGTEYPSKSNESTHSSQTPAESMQSAQAAPQSSQVAQTVQSNTRPSQTASITQTVPDYKPDGQYMKFSQYQETLKQAGYNNVTLDPQNTTNQQADGYVYSVYPQVGESVNKDQEIVVTYSTYNAPSNSSTSSESNFKN